MAILLRFIIVTVLTQHTLAQHNIRGEELREELALPSKSKNSASIRGTRSGREEYPCPDAEAIYPCRCTSGFFFYLTCRNVTSDQLTAIFQQDFPETHFDELEILDSPMLTSLNFDFNGVTLAIFVAYDTPIETIAPEFLMGSAGTLQALEIYDSKLTTEGFPFDTLASYDNLGSLILFGNNVDSVPSITSPSLKQLDIVQANISEILPGKCAN